MFFDSHHITIPYRTTRVTLEDSMYFSFWTDQSNICKVFDFTLITHLTSKNLSKKREKKKKLHVAILLVFFNSSHELIKRLKINSLLKDRHVLDATVGLVNFVGLKKINFVQQKTNVVSRKINVTSLNENFVQYIYCCRFVFVLMQYLY